ncbi:FUSC family protein [Variovorax sp. J22G73]|uniref:FUSC family protein n=1 Tax=unclassified Variovorax TaxID=663243 RepID=UPI00257842E0|nr:MULTISPECIES: FUSC family protein [unclassified Variovorax]MDM0008730.1 FUSC family protein [Variovorax sp. J22R203]MDM0101434.1 FUSC family protein [Variovorax sp. J22G73]
MASLSLPRFTRAELLFSAKSFAAAMLAMYLASRAGLPRPFWALMTTYVVAHPLAGAVRSKALYRFCGTLIGSTATVLLVPALSNAPELLTLVLALWVGLCLCISLFDRTPRSYVFMLAGYTAALIGFPSVQTPLVLFDTAVARVEEIGLGIFCATLVHSLVLPAGLAPTVLGLLDRTLVDARKWLGDLLQPAGRDDAGGRTKADPKRLDDDRRRLAGDITQLRLLSTHVPFDTTHLRWTAGAIRAMQDRVAALTPALSAVEDRLQALEQAEGRLAPDVAAVLAQAAQWLHDEAEPTADAAARGQRLQALRRAIDGLSTPPAAADAQPTPWGRALRIGLAGRLEELIDGWTACGQLRLDIDEGLKGAAPLRRTAALGARVLHRDYGMALLSALAAVIAICLCGAFWIVTGWPMGSAATMMAAVFCCFFATMDDPVPAIHGFLKWTLWSVPISAVYVLVLMPTVQDFGMLVAICAPLFLLLGLYLPRPTHFMPAMALVFGVAGTLALHDTASSDLVSFINSMIGQIVGVVVAARVTRLVRSVGADWSARRIQRATWRELGDMAASSHPQYAQSDAYAVRMLDRIGLLAPRIAQAGGTVEGVAANDALRDLRMGADIVVLQRVRAQLPLATSAALLDSIARFFRQRGEGRMNPRPPGLLPQIDEALSAVLETSETSEAREARDGAASSASASSAPASSSASSAASRSAITALVGLRRNLFPEAPPMLARAPVQGASA